MKKENTKKSFLRIGTVRLMICLFIGIVVVVGAYITRSSKSSDANTVSPTPIASPTTTAIPVELTSWLDKVEYTTDEIVKTGNVVEAHVVIKNSSTEDAEHFAAEYQTMLLRLNPGVQKATIYLYINHRDKGEMWDMDYTDHLEAYVKTS